MGLNKDRIAIVIGKNGETKKKIEDLTGTKIIIDSDNGEYKIESNENAKPLDPTLELEPISIRSYSTDHIIRAINFGFNPVKALQLIDPEIFLEVIDLENVLGHSEKKLKRIRGRMIGDQGKVRNSIEQFSTVSVSIYDKYIGLIGNYDSIRIAKKSINMIIQGSPIKTVMNFLQHEHQKKKQEEFTKIWKPTL